MGCNCPSKKVINPTKWGISPLSRSGV